MSAWILLRGLTREARHWAQLPERLRASGLAGEIVCLDLPGSGIHQAMRSPVSVSAMLEFVRADVRARGYTPPFRVLAMSLGAMVATAWAQQAPHEIERLALINTSMRPFCSARERLCPGAWPELLCAALRWRDRSDAEAAIHLLTCNRLDQRDADLAVWAAIYRSAPVSRANACRQLWAAAHFAAAATPPRCPTLLVSSTRDALVDPVCSRKIAAAWSAAHLEHPWAGHDLPHDDPAWLADALAAWSFDVLAGEAEHGR
ncbi:alpha/beta fold hydrolase [Trinickia fusca]|uniref:Alpha/beta hydrolase n=1 Tax=Trinickia fusca TaxID=2419777 RepID=A0A494XCJ8_9BURK|nr:alpha/beta hydrolase [Trinickia fusca]RKP47632.1 alpha/beta hydrolase [Trinickia fusca]